MTEDAMGWRGYDDKRQRKDTGSPIKNVEDDRRREGALAPALSQGARGKRRYRCKCFMAAAQRMMKMPIQRPAFWKGMGSAICSSFSCSSSSPVGSMRKMTV